MEGSRNALRTFKVFSVLDGNQETDLNQDPSLGKTKEKSQKNSPGKKWVVDKEIELGPFIVWTREGASKEGAEAGDGELRRRVRIDLRS